MVNPMDGQAQMGNFVHDQLDIVINVVAVPVITGIIVWLWKLDARIFQISSTSLSRNEFKIEIQSIHNEFRTEVQGLREDLRNLTREIHNSQPN